MYLCRELAKEKFQSIAEKFNKILAVWGPMEPLLESMDIAVLQPITLTF